MRARLGIAIVVVASVASTMAGCADLPTPEVGSPPTSQPEAGDRLAPTVPTADEPQAELEQDTPPRPDGYVSEVVVAAPDQLEVLDQGQFLPLGGTLAGVVATTVADDFFGGLVVQQSDERVMWFPGEGGDATQVNEQGGRLLDVGISNGTPEAILSGDDGGLDRVRLVTGERDVLAVLAADRALVDLSGASGLYAVAYRDEGCGGIVLLSATGEEIDALSAPAESCPVPGRSLFGEVALSPESGLYAYTEVSYRSDEVEAATDIVGRELGTAAELFRIPVGESGEQVSSLAFDGTRVLFQRTSLSDEERTGLYVVNLTTPDTPEVETPSFPAATLARRPLTAGRATEG